MSLGPMKVGDLGPPIRGQIKRKAVPYSLIGIPLTLYFQDAHTGVSFIGQGNFTLVDPANGIFDYFFAPSDTKNPALYDVFPRVVDPIAGPMTGSSQPLEILPPITLFSQQNAVGRISIS